MTVRFTFAALQRADATHGVLRLTAALLSAASLVLAGCSKPAPPEPPATPKLEGNTVVFPGNSPQIAALVSAPVKPRRDTIVAINGRLAWDEDRTVRVASPFAGRVASINVKLGDAVKAGQPLAVVVSAELGQAQADARRAGQDAAFTAKNLARVQELHGAGVAAAKELQAAQADFDRARAEQLRATERLKLYGANRDAIDQQLVIRAPIAGVVVDRSLNPGQELRPDQPAQNGLLVISDPTRLWFVLDANERDVTLLKPGTEVVLRQASVGIEKFAGTVTYVADTVDPTTRTVRVRGRVDNPERVLKAEMFVVAKIHVPSTGGLVVPTRAVYLHGDTNYVFVDQGAGHYERRSVKLGPAMNGDQVVLEGLLADESVVVDGNLLLERIVAARR